MFEKKTLQQLQNVNSAFSAFRKRRRKRKNVRNFRDHSISSTRVSEQLLKVTLKMHDLKMTDKLLANCEHNYGVWKMQEYKSSWVQPTHTVYIKEAVRDTLQSSTGMSSHLQWSVFRTSGATAALRTSVIITNYCWHIAYKECCNLADRKRQEFAMKGSTEYRAIPKGRGFVYAYCWYCWTIMKILLDTRACIFYQIMLWQEYTWLITS